MLLDDVVRTSAEVADRSSRIAKIDQIAGLLARAEPDEVGLIVGFLTGELPQGRIGVGWATLSDLRSTAAARPTLLLDEVDDAFSKLASATGAGSQAIRNEILEELLGRATSAEAWFLQRLLLGEMRQGALAGVMVEAIAKAFDVAPGLVRRAHMLDGDLARVARVAQTEGPTGLERTELTVLRPVRPMLAQSAESIAEAVGRVSGDLAAAVAVEWKFDGARIQVHRHDRAVKVFTRNLNDMTDRVPEIVDVALALPATSFILDGEVMWLDRGGVPRPFQDTMSHFGRDAPNQAPDTLLTPFFFDLLSLDGSDLTDLPASDRFRLLDRLVPQDLRTPRLETTEVGRANDFFEGAIAAGHEGVMVKALDSPYAAGRRGSGWIKVKPVHTLDLVILAAEWGHGRRRGWLSNLHLGARDSASGDFVMLGKTFKGLTDQMLEWQTSKLQELADTGAPPPPWEPGARGGHVVRVRPEVVVEVAFDAVQRSSRYPGGMALRFARVKGYRPDKTADDADTIETVRSIFERGHRDL